MALAIGTRLGPYEVSALIGESGMGVVYRARDTKLQRDVALKILLPEVANDPERLARFRREAQVLASLNHPHIGAIHGHEESDGTIALVLELVEGTTLAKQIAEALEAAHDQRRSRPGAEPSIGAQISGRSAACSTRCSPRAAPSTARTSPNTIAAVVSKEPDWQRLPPATPPAIATLSREERPEAAAAHRRRAAGSRDAGGDD